MPSSRMREQADNATTSVIKDIQGWEMGALHILAWLPTDAKCSSSRRSHDRDFEILKESDTLSSSVSTIQKTILPVV